MAHRAEDRPPAVRPALDYRPPAAGTYALPVIQSAPDGEVVGQDGKLHRLADYTRGRVTLLSLIYTYCIDPGGCILAYETGMELKQRIIADPALHGRVRFVSLSFDPFNDTHASMQAYGGKHARKDGPLPWHFLTTRSMKSLSPILEGFGQDIEIEHNGHGKARRTITHMLKVFLIDRVGGVREIYSTAFLHPDTMLNDIRTLVLEEERRR
ncbi:MAG TPA: SCO family protein [Casimicrobiaceae bacterium]|nr:SCO family protein [Casimicrobiaceae bacterium]